MNTQLNRTRRIVFAALFIALCFVGGNIKIYGSIAFDSLPAFVATLVLGGAWGAVIGAIAHMLSAALSGFPLSLPVHLMTAVGMALTMAAFYYSIKWSMKKLSPAVSYVIGCVVAVIFNVPVALLLSAPFMGFKTAMALIPALVPAAILNVVIAVIVYNFLPAKYQTLPGFTKKKSKNNHQNKNK